MKELANQIVMWLKDYAIKNNRKSFVVGVSGGVDSALVSTLCEMTGITTICVVLPCHSKEIEIQRAIGHIGWLQNKRDDVRFIRINLSKTFDEFKQSLYGDFDSKLADANSKSRLRMVALYQVAATNQGLVVGTGNRVEDFGVGFFTKYGDGGVDISPIGDLTKTEVWKMARELGINQEIIDVAPTDGLWDDARTDESQLGATYAELEWAMEIEDIPENIKPPGIYAGFNERQWEVYKTYQKWHKAGAHKLNPIPTFRRK